VFCDNFRAIRKWIVFALCAGLALLAVPPVAAKSTELSKWPEGPIRYIARKDEIKEFKSLETDEARAIFIQKFWRRRDPSAGTLTNEYREMFWRRVQEANNSFIESSKPGWMTDRGKIWILYGPPSDIETYDDLQSDRTTGRGVIRWIYEGRPGQRMDVDPIVVVPFQRDSSGEYIVSYDPRLSSVFFDALAISEGRFDQYDRFLEMVSSPSTSELSVMLDLGRMQEVPPADQVLLETVETMEAYQTLPLNVNVDRYFRPDDGQPIAVISVDLRDVASPEKPAIIARMVPQVPEAESRVLGEDSFRVFTGDDYRTAQGRLALDPGKYRLTVVVADPVAIQTGIETVDVDIPEIPDTIRLSDTVWAVDVEPVRYKSLASYDEPFHVGPFRVLPKPDSVYRQGEVVMLFFEVYGADYPLRATFQLEGRDENGQWIALGQPSVIEQTAGELAWEVPTNERWPVGAYRVRIEVTDAGDRLVTTQVEFELALPEPS
jgi:GWxTD domain-containing protein